MNKRPEATFTCPWWLLFTFDNPLRKLVHDPVKILQPYVRPGETALDIGCGMGYFTLALARLVGNGGQTIAADLQPQMLGGLARRAARAGLMERIRLHHCTPDRIGLEVAVDFALAFWMVHEVRRRDAFLEEVFGLLKPGGRLLIVEPIIHVPAQDFERTVSICRKIGFKEQSRPRIGASRAIVFTK